MKYNMRDEFSICIREINNLYLDDLSNSVSQVIKKFDETILITGYEGLYKLKMLIFNSLLSGIKHNIDNYYNEWPGFEELEKISLILGVNSVTIEKIRENRENSRIQLVTFFEHLEITDVTPINVLQYDNDMARELAAEILLIEKLVIERTNSYHTQIENLFLENICFLPYRKFSNPQGIILSEFLCIVREILFEFAEVGDKLIEELYSLSEGRYEDELADTIQNFDINNESLNKFPDTDGNINTDKNLLEEVPNEKNIDDNELFEIVKKITIAYKDKIKSALLSDEFKDLVRKFIAMIPEDELVELIRIVDPEIETSVILVIIRIIKKMAGVELLEKNNEELENPEDIPEIELVDILFADMDKLVLFIIKTGIKAVLIHAGISPAMIKQVIKYSPLLISFLKLLSENSPVVMGSSSFENNDLKNTPRIEKTRNVPSGSNRLSPNVTEGKKMQISDSSNEIGINNPKPLISNKADNTNTEHNNLKNKSYKQPIEKSRTENYTKRIDGKSEKQPRIENSNNDGNEYLRSDSKISNKVGHSLPLSGSEINSIRKKQRKVANNNSKVRNNDMLESDKLSDANNHDSNKLSNQAFKNAPLSKDNSSTLNKNFKQADSNAIGRKIDNREKFKLSNGIIQSKDKGRHLSNREKINRNGNQIPSQNISEGKKLLNSGNRLQLKPIFKDGNSMANILDENIAPLNLFPQQYKQIKEAIDAGMEDALSDKKSKEMCQLLLGKDSSPTQQELESFNDSLTTTLNSSKPETFIEELRRNMMLDKLGYPMKDGVNSLKTKEGKQLIPALDEESNRISLNRDMEGPIADVFSARDTDNQVLEKVLNRLYIGFVVGILLIPYIGGFTLPITATIVISLFLKNETFDSEQLKGIAAVNTTIGRDRTLDMLDNYDYIKSDQGSYLQRK